MSSVRKFKSIDERISNSKRRDSAAAMGERSGDNAKDATQAFSKEKQNPLGTDTNDEAKPGITFAAQDKLPKLPIPDLEATCKRYLASLDPLQTAREHHDSERAVEEFLHGDGPELQAKLKAYSEGKTSYIEQFCKCFDYL
jgi:carnitine O-acetyltransferase